MDHQPRTSSSFNETATVDAQERTIEIAQLHELGELFVSEGIYQSLGVGLLHRHTLLPDECIMLQETSLGSNVNCTVQCIKSFGDKTLSPSVLCDVIASRSSHILG